MALALSVAIAVALSLHLLMTAIYLGPPNLAKLELQKLVFRYMEPVFIQNWHLFSPMPAISSTKMPVRCQASNGTWTEWVDPLEDLYATHYRTRISGHGKLLMLYRAVGADLHERLAEQRGQCLAEANEEGSDPELCGLSHLAPRVEDQPERALASRYASEICSANLGEQYQASQFKVMDFVPVKFSERNTSTARWGSVTEVTFPPTSDPGGVL